MKRIRTSRHARLTPRVETLAKLSEAYAEASSQLEEDFWGKKLDDTIKNLLAEQNEESLNTALDHLHGSNSDAYDMLADRIEAQCETRTIAAHDIQLIAIPVLAWSRFSIPAATIPPDTLAAIQTQLHSHVLASQAKLSLANYLFSPDHLPQGFCPTAEMTQRLGEAALKQKPLVVDGSELPECMKFLSDTRYIIGAIAVPQGEALFSWQEKGNRADAERNWQNHGGPVLQSLLTGCATEPGLPLAYFTACRNTDRASRPFSLQASVDFLKTTLNLSASELRAVIAPFYEEQLEEYRIGFTLGNQSEVVYGMVWPLLDAEDDVSDTATHIETRLKEMGVESVLVLEQRFPVEYCDDCGSPLYPNPEGEIVHAELPDEEADAIPRHLH